MSARIEIALIIEGDGATETAMREHCAWLERHARHQPEYHELIAHLAMMMARKAWAEADLYRRLREEAEARKAKAAARRAATGEERT